MNPLSARARTGEDAHPWYTAALGLYLVLALVLGGASQDNDGFDLVLRLAGLPLLAMGALRLLTRGDVSRPALLFLGSLFLLPLVQLIPLPPALWSALPGRAALANDLVAVGAGETWRPVSLAPGATIDALLGLTPFAAVFLGVLTLRRSQAETLWLLVAVIAVISVGLGGFQLGGGPSSPFRLYGPDAGRAATGFFANRNHWAAFLVASLPAVAAWSFQRRASADRGRSGVALILGAVACLALLAGVAISGSRAGAGLLLLCALGLAPWLGVGRQGDPRRLLLPGLLLVVSLGLAVAESWVAADRFADAPRDLRFDIWAEAGRIAAAHLPFGTGAGSFSAVFAGVETPDDLTAGFTNQAHNDWLEVVVEYGLLALLPAAFLLLLLQQAWRHKGSQSTLALLALAVLLAASLVDYPLRTSALQVLMALLLASLAVRTRDRAAVTDGDQA